MKIGIVLTNSPGYSETFFRSKISSLLKKGFEVELFVDSSTRDFKLCKQHVLPEAKVLPVLWALIFLFLRRPFRTIRLFRLEKKCRSSIKEVYLNVYKNIHLLNASGLQWVHFGFAVTGVGRENIGEVIDARLAISFRGYDISRVPLRAPEVYSLLWKKVSKVHSISNALYEKAIALGLSPSVPHLIIHPAVELSDIPERAKSVTTGKPIKLVTIARLHWAKGLDYTIQALRILKSKGIDFTYTIIGDGPAKEQLIVLAHQAGINQHITFMNVLQHKEVLEYLAGETDIYIQYSVQEGFCNAVLEAQAIGLSVIVSSAEGLPENVLDKTTGWVVPSRNPDALASKLFEVINMSEEDRNRIASNARERVNNDFTMERQLRQFVDFYLD